MFPIWSMGSVRKGTFHVNGLLGHNYGHSEYECAHISFIFKAITLSSGIAKYSAQGILNSTSAFKQIRYSITSGNIASLDVLIRANEKNSYWFIPLEIGFNEREVLNLPYYCDLALEWSRDPKDRSIEVFTQSVTNVTVS